MPYIVVTGTLATAHLLKEDGAAIYGLNREERMVFVNDFNATFKSNIASSQEPERTVKINQKGLTLVVVNRLHALLGYDVISHSMAITSTNRELASWTMYKKSGLNHKKLHMFEVYQKARLTFVQAVAEMATRAVNAPCLESAGVLELLKPLLADASPTVRQCAAAAAARLAEADDTIARKVIDQGLLLVALENLNKFNVYYKRAALYLMRAVAKHNEQLAADVVRLNALEHIVASLEDFDTAVKENAAWALGYIGRHSEELSANVVDAGALPLLVLAYQEPEISLKQIAAGAIVDLAQHKPESVVDAGAIFHLVRGLDNQDSKLKRVTLAALSAVASARGELAEAVVAGGALPPALLHAGHDAPAVRRQAACLLRDMVKHSVDLAQLVVNSGGCGPLVALVGDPAAGARVPASMALGFIAGQSDQLAMAVITCKAIPILVEVLQNTESCEAELSAAAWALGHVGKHSPHHSQAVAVSNAFPRLLQLYTLPTSSPELRARACCALKQCLQCCLHRPALEPLLHSAPPQILKYVLGQYAKILPNDARARRLFVTTGALKRIQEIDAVPGTSLKEFINIINSCFPEEIVRYYTPGYSDTLLDKVESYTPQIPELFMDRDISECQSQISVEHGD